MSGLTIRSAGNSHQGSVREHNEDALIVDQKWGLYAVLDGMGGAASGDVAANKARDVIHEYVRARRSTMQPRPLLEAAINAASAAVHGEAQRRRDRRGMGTTVVACLVDGRRATVAHVGDSRAYLLRDGRLHRLTNDHTIVAELVARGALAADEADRHAYKNVLSRNLGAKPVASVDVSEVELQPGDRLMLCSDGLYGYAPSDAVHHLVASTDPPEEVVRDLIEAALRGGGGDNVTAIVVEAGIAAVPRATMVLRTTGAGAWWARRERFLAAAHAGGIHRSPLCSVLGPDEAIAIVAGNFADAIYHDLEKVDRRQRLDLRREPGPGLAGAGRGVAAAARSARRPVARRRSGGERAAPRGRRAGRAGRGRGGARHGHRRDRGRRRAGRSPAQPRDRAGQGRGRAHREAAPRHRPLHRSADGAAPPGPGRGRRAGARRVGGARGVAPPRPRPRPRQRRR